MNIKLIPKLRFKDENGYDYPKLEEKKLGDWITKHLRSIDKPNKPYKSLGIRSHTKGTIHNNKLFKLKKEIILLKEYKQGLLQQMFI